MLNVALIIRDTGTVSTMIGTRIAKESDSEVRLRLGSFLLVFPVESRYLFFFVGFLGMEFHFHFFKKFTPLLLSESVAPHHCCPLSRHVIVAHCHATLLTVTPHHWDRSHHLELLS